MPVTPGTLASQSDEIEEKSTALVAAQPPPIVWQLPEKPREADHLWQQWEQNFPGQGPPSKEVKEYYDSNTGGTQSYSERTVTITREGTGDSITIAAKTSTTVGEVKDMLETFTHVSASKLVFKRKVGRMLKIQADIAECGSQVTVQGLRSFKRHVHEYKHPILIIGGGLGGIQQMVQFQNDGRTDFVCMEVLEDFGGKSWMVVANKFTQLQTERGTYYVDYLTESAPMVPDHFGDQPYDTWPKRHQLLEMFRESGRRHGLYEKTHFGTTVEKMKVMGSGISDRQYAVSYTTEDDAGMMMCGAVAAWPGNLCLMNELTWPGEDTFGGECSYSSFGMTDYDKAIGKTCILYGHGAFTIENIRTLMEHRAKKVFILCRKRNICGMKVTSWLVAYMQAPMPGPIMVEMMNKMYALVGVDIWDHESVKTDKKRSFAHVSQKTVFGVTDIYFLAGYFGLMEVIIDEITHLSPGKAHTKKGQEIECDMIIKAVGTKPDFKIDKMLGCKELVGLWVNGDPLRSCFCNAMFVEARNFGTFSSGPGFASLVHVFCHMFDFPEDMDLVYKELPRNRAGERPAYVPTSTHMLPSLITLMSLIPSLGQRASEVDNLKWKRQQVSHLPEVYLESCKAEWAMYTKHFRDSCMVDDRPDPPYPYTMDEIHGWMQKTNEFWAPKPSVENIAAAEAGADVAPKSIED